MAERTVRVAWFRYRVPLLEGGKPVKNDKGDPVYVEKTAWHGDTVDVPLQDDVDRGDQHGLFASADTPVSEKSDAELEAWIRDEKPTAKDVVAAAGSDPVLAGRLLAAETLAREKPRQEVSDGLDKLVRGGDEQ